MSYVSRYIIFEMYDDLLVLLQAYENKEYFHFDFDIMISMLQSTSTGWRLFWWWWPEADDDERIGFS